VASEAGLSAAPPAAHERGKNKRRRAILDAARDIILREGEAGMTMRSMAAQAGVSPATPYNLFGSKQAILQAIYDEDYVDYVRYFEERASTDALIRIFDLAHISIEYFELQPDFYRALFGILQRHSGSDVEASSWSLRMAYLQGLLRDCVAAGELRDDSPIELVSSALLRIFKAIAQEWVEGALSLEDARNELGVSFGLVLASLITAKGAPAFGQARGRYGPVH
jgi:AcrR family transcriptional regulator